MSEIGPGLRFALAVLATWRITHLLAREDGPAELLARLRARLGDRFAGQLMDCFHCLSVWVAAPIALLVARRPSDLWLVWLALSGAACLLERVGEDPVIIQPMSRTFEEDTSDGMLRSEPNADEDHRTRQSSGADAGAVFAASRAE